MNEWILLSDRQPADGQTVLVFGIEFLGPKWELPVEHMEVVKAWLRDGHMRFVDSHTSRLLFKVTHWQPRPAAPVEVGAARACPVHGTTPSFGCAECARIHLG